MFVDADLFGADGDAVDADVPEPGAGNDAA